MTRCEINEIFRGKIAAVQNYGAFVEIPGCKQQGLIHKSQVSSTWVDDVSEVLKRGESVWCKIISIGDDGKIGLSMKFVNQGNGTDMDPNGVEQQRDEQKKKPFPQQRKAIELEAVLNSICRRCKLKGHFEHDCFSSLDGKKYDLIPEIEDDLPVEAQQTLVPEKLPDDDKLLKADKKSKSKKLKKKKSKKKRSVSSSSDDSSYEEEKKHKKKKKKHSKQKKRKHSESSSDDSSDDVYREKHSKKCKHSRSKHSD
ncbi:zinc finger CCHC domain-containing protein 17-like [Microplitis demolitor]|uniref:zinc finger CCHC domain-containing protein 17-like n=1 Tax=Microplitis demolitor TaxID=69319 RepID=UPI0004CD1AA1|nr:zinc finger CCHC domain-containing protein 17-like [Microplitis demolitor]